MAKLQTHILYVWLQVALKHVLGFNIRPSWVHVNLFIYNIEMVTRNCRISSSGRALV